jgi:hypothetical protein
MRAERLKKSRDEKERKRGRKRTENNNTGVVHLGLDEGGVLRVTRDVSVLRSEEARGKKGQRTSM